MIQIDFAEKTKENERKPQPERMPKAAPKAFVMSGNVPRRDANAGPSNAASGGTALLDEAPANLAHGVPTGLKEAIMQARKHKKLTQARLAQMINVAPQDIQDYESGNATPNLQMIGKLEWAVGCKLGGKK